MNVAWRAVDLRQLLLQMSKVNWEVRDIMSQHSPYVDFILRVNTQSDKRQNLFYSCIFIMKELQIFSMRLSEISKKVPVPKSTKVLLWQLLSHLVCNAFVEGYVKKNFRFISQ
jgi:syndetin